MEAFKDSQWVELMAPIHTDLFMQDRLLVNQCEIRVELHRNDDKFCILSKSANTESYKIEVKQMSLFVKKCEISE